MILEKEFYFVRHGQTDYNLLVKKDKGDHHADTPLNQTGVGQAQAIEPVIALLPIRTICASPMKRAQQTKEIVSARIKAPHHAIDELGECSAEVWQEMRVHKNYAKLPPFGKARFFVDRIRKGINDALAKPGPVLIVAHGGVHFALCSYLAIEEHDWVTDNCVPIHFVFDGKWRARDSYEKAH